MTTTTISSPGIPVSHASNQRKVARTQNDNLWVCYAHDAYIRLKYSQNDGVTWSAEQVIGTTTSWMGTGTTYNPNLSFFIDIDDYAHVTYKDRHDGFVYYRRGTPNAARTAWTWSAATAIRSDTFGNHPDIVAHREGTGWVAHIVASRHDSTTTDNPLYYRVTITSAGGITASGATSLGGVYGNTVSKFPSVDFRHTGDGKTVSANGPDLFVAWSAGKTGAGLGIRFRKAVYSAGSWTWNAEREIDPNFRFEDGDAYMAWGLGAFDGVRAVICGAFRSSTDTFSMRLYERDLADTITTVRTVSPTRTVYGGSVGIDSEKNIFFIGGEKYFSGMSEYTDIYYFKWDRATLAAGPIVNVHSSGSGDIRASASRHNIRILDYIYMWGAFGGDLMYGDIKLLAAIKHWNGSFWKLRPLKRQTDSGWKGVPHGRLKRWNGTSWVPA